MFMNIKNNCGLEENSENVFVNIFCVPELQKLKFLTQREIMVTQISAALPFPNFHSGKSYVKKNNSVWFLAICVNYSCKIEKFEVEVVGIGVLGTRFGF